MYVYIVYWWGKISRWLQLLLFGELHIWYSILTTVQNCHQNSAYIPTFCISITPYLNGFQSHWASKTDFGSDLKWWSFPQLSHCPSAEITVNHWLFSDLFQHFWLTKIHFGQPNFLYIFIGTAISKLLNILSSKIQLTNFWFLFLALCHDCCMKIYSTRDMSRDKYRVWQMSARQCFNSASSVVHN